MTPTEQDNELRRNICGIATGVLWGKSFNELTLNERSRVNAMAKDLEAYITADRKRVALEERIDEINYLDDNFQADSQDWEREHPGYSTAMIPMEDYIRRRTELKQELEKL